MKIHKNTDDELITKISEILKDFKDFQKPYVKNNGNIIIKKKFIKKESNDFSVLTNIFKEIIKNDVKKNRV